MKVFKVNFNGGIDVFNENQKFLIHLNNNDLKTISDIQQKESIVDTLVDRIPEWVDEQIQLNGYSYENFNSHLYSSDEITLNEISTRILSNKELIQKIVNEFNEYDDGDIEHDYFKCLDGAILSVVSIEDVMGEILCEKHPKELEIGQWRVRVVEKGDIYGVENRVPWNDEKPLVEFYDMNVDKKDFPEGRFTTGRYYIDKLLNPGLFGSSLDDMVEKNKGFNLNPIYVEWTVQPGDLAVISAWLKAVQDNIVRNTEKFIYYGEVDVPFGFNNLEKYYDYNSAYIGAAYVFECLRAFPSYFQDISIECFGEYDRGCGFNFSFSTTADAVTVESLVKHVFKDLKYEIESKNEKSLEKTLADAAKRSEVAEKNFSVLDKSSQELNF